MIAYNYIVKASGIVLPVSIGLYRTTIETVLRDFYDPSARLGWCQAGGTTCPQYGCRPCCPPVFPELAKLPRRKYLYILISEIEVKAYEQQYPGQAGKPFLLMGGTHKMTRRIIHDFTDAVCLHGEQGFKVGGCTGCTVKNTGKCNKKLRPALEATGINVCALYKFLTGREIEWHSTGNPMTHMVAVGGVYTDREISKKQMKEALKCLSYLV